MPSVQSIVKRVYLGCPLVLFCHDCFFDGLQHVPTLIAELGFVELVLPESLDLDAFLFEEVVLVEVAFFDDENILFEAAHYFLVDVKVEGPGLHQFGYTFALPLHLLEFLSR